MPDLAAFMKHNIEGYLFFDIRKLQVPDATTRGVGFPLLMTVFSGIEFLGSLLSSSAGERAFAFYWRKHLYAASSTRAEFGAPLYQLVRHGIAHAFMLKGNLGVLQRTPALHLSLSANGDFIIDAAELADDFIGSYQNSVRPIIECPAGDPTRQGVQRRLDKLADNDLRAVKRHWGALAKAPQVDLTTFVSPAPAI